MFIDQAEGEGVALLSECDVSATQPVCTRVGRLSAVLINGKHRTPEGVPGFHFLCGL
jgi:hypothetical protein